MRNGWTTQQLGELSAIGYGYTDSARSEAVGPRFLRITDIQDDRVDWDLVPFCSIEAQNLPKYRLSTGDIVFARTGATTGKSFLVQDPPEAVFASYLIRLRLKNGKLLPEYLSYFFKSDQYWNTIREGSTGSAQGGFNASKLAMVRVPFPSVLDQKRIVRVLHEAFQAIAAAKVNAEKNLQNARALFVNHLNAVFDHPGPNWLFKPVRDIARHSLGKMLDKAKNRGIHRPYLRNLNVRWFTFNLSDLLMMPFLPDEEAKYTARKGDVLVCEGGYPGRAAIWVDDAPIYFQKAIHRVRFHEPEHAKWFVFYLYAKDARNELKAHFSGTGIQHFTGEALGRFLLPLPPRCELSRAVSSFEEIHSGSEALEAMYIRKLAALDELKKSLLHQAFTGKL